MQPRLRKRALTLVEILIGVFIIGIAIVTLFTSFSSHYKMSAMTRNRTAAILLAGNFVEEMKAHHYGQPAPVTWPDDAEPPSNWDANFIDDDPHYEKLDLLVYGRPAKLVFYRQLEFKNGSFVGTSNDKSDVATLTIHWREQGDKAIEGYKSMEIEVAVRKPW